MKKPIIIILSGLATLILIYLFTDIRYAFKLFNVSSAGNEPTLKIGDILIGTNLKKPKKLDFVFYQQDLKGYPKGIWFQRLCGVEYDTIQIVNGYLFINGINVDENLTLNHQYKMEQTLAMELLKNGDISEKDIRELKNDTTYLNLSDNLASQYPEKIKRSTKTYNHQDIVTTYGKKWTEDNFGPIVVPKSSFFFLGDNRNASYDSRFFGFVEEKKVKGVLIN